MSEKPRFKDKFKAVVAEAESAQAQAIQAEQAQDARSLATDLLINGFPAAFCGASSMFTWIVAQIVKLGAAQSIIRAYALFESIWLGAQYHPA